jgi:hypothetical protein
MAEKINLTNEDWEALLPESDYTLGKTKLPLRPLGVTEVAKVAKVIQKSMALFAERKITMDNFGEPQNIVVLVDVIMEHAPDLVSDCSGLALEDVKALPVEWAVDLVRALIDLNIKSKESLEKNLRALAEAMKKLGGENGESETLSNS